MLLKAYTRAGGEIEMTDHGAIDHLIFAPSADLAGLSVPVNEFQADVHTEDDIEIGAYAELYDDRENLWAAYWVIESRRVAPGVLRLRAQSDVALLQRVVLPAVYCDGWPVTRLLDQILGESVSVPYALDPSLSGATITGFCPEQTARERLLWVCFVIGGCVRGCFNRALEIGPVDAAAKRVPPEDTYWKPRVTQGDWVTALRARAYTFTQRDPLPGERYVVSATGVCYVSQETEIVLENQDAPAAAPENVIRIDGVTLVNPDNVSAILSRVARWAFKRTRVTLEAVDNGDFLPGDRVSACTGAGEMVTGYIDRAEFEFGQQARARLHLTGVERLPSGTLQILFFQDDSQVGRADYTFPAGYAYAIDNPWLDLTRGPVRQVLRPLNARAEGVIREGLNTSAQPCAAALSLQDNELTILSVDGVDENGGIS